MAIPKDKLIPLYRMMLLIRQFEEKARTLFLDGELPGFLHSSFGQEAIPATVSLFLKPSDYIVSTHRGHGDIIAKGASVDKMMAELYAKKTGYCKGKGGSMHIADLDLGILGATGIVGGGLPIINGAALAAKMNGTDQLGVCYFGDGASNEGTFHESLNLAAIWDLPVLFVCENNQYAESTPVTYHQKASALSDRAAGYGIPGLTLDGNDPFAMYDEIKKAVTRARAGEGPTLLNCVTYRILGHYIGDPGTGYRESREVEEAKQREPINRLREQLLKMKALNHESDAQIMDSVKKEIEKAVEYARNSPEPDEAELMSDVYFTV